jgi:hypothetical protein
MCISSIMVGKCMHDFLEDQFLVEKQQGTGRFADILLRKVE